MDKCLKFLGKSTRNIFFCGIGGVSMRSLALLARKCGHTVMGSDTFPSDELIRLCRENGIPLFFSHDAENVKGCDIFVYSAAVDEKNPERAAAKVLGMSIFSRAEFLAGVTDSFPVSVAVSGTHGKSTVTALIYKLLSEMSEGASMFCGASSLDANGFFDISGENYCVYEACEYKRSFLNFHPTLAVILNIEHEHIDTYATVEEAKNAYYEFASTAKKVLVCRDSTHAYEVGRRLEASGKKVFYYSLDCGEADFYAKEINETNGRYEFMLGCKGEWVNVRSPLLGRHNVQNALAGAAVAEILGLCEKERLCTGMEKFKGISGRGELIGHIGNADIYDDYAHHPSEIKATLAAFSRLKYDKTVCVFQSHTYSRTNAFFEEFSHSFEACDEVIFADIFPAREKNIYGVSAKALAKATENGLYLGDFENIYRYLCDMIISEKDQRLLILTMGAGNVNSVGRRLLDLEL